MNTHNTLLFFQQLYHSIINNFIFSGSTLPHLGPRKKKKTDIDCCPAYRPDIYEWRTAIISVMPPWPFTRTAFSSPLSIEQLPSFNLGSHGCRSSQNTWGSLPFLSCFGRFQTTKMGKIVKYFNVT